MSDYIVAFPAASRNMSPRLASFERYGKDGNEVVVPLFGGDRFVGEALSGKWKKYTDGNLVGFIARLTSGHLELTGASHAAGTSEYGFVSSNSQIYLKDDTTVIVELECPAAVTSPRAVGIELDLVAVYAEGNDPQDETDWLKIQLQNDDGTYEYRVRKSVGGTESDVVAWTEVTNSNVIFKLVFSEKKDGHTHIYLDDGESGTYAEVDDSPFELNLNFDRAHAVLCLETSDATARTCLCDYVTVNYPDFQIKFDAPRGDRSGTESLYAEAEDCTLGGGADKENLADDVNWSARLNAQNEYVTFDLNPVTDYLSRGRYLALVRIKDTAQVSDDVQLRAYNVTDSTYMNIENTTVTKTAEGTFKVFELIFDVDAEDASDSCQLRVLKSTATANTIYVDWFRVVPYDGINGNCEVYDTKIEETEADWLEGWRKRTKFTIPAALLDDNLLWFPFLVYLSSSSGTNSVDMTRVFNELGDNRLKIAITTSDGLTQLYCEVNYWSSAQGICEVWCSKDGFTLSDSVDNEFYLYYDKEHNDNTAYVGVAGSTPAQQIWNTDFKFRSSMSDDPDTSSIKDSTAYGNDGAKSASNEPLEVAGQIGKAQQHDGENDHITISSSTDFEPTSDFTIEFWCEILSSPTDWEGILQHGQWTGDWNFQLLSSGTINGWIDFTTTGASYQFVSPVGLHYYVVTIKGTVVKWYYDGNLVETDAAVGTYNLGVGNDVYIGTKFPDATATNHSNIKMDELRYSKDIDRSPSWVSASYKAQTDSLIEWGSEETADWRQVFSADHSFVGDLVANNGQARIEVDEKAQYGLKLKYWQHAGWIHPLDRLTLYLASDAKELAYPFLSHISVLSSEEVCFDVRLEDSAVQDSDYYADLKITMKRGNPYIQIEVLEVYPVQDARFKWLNSTALRFGYIGDAETHGIGDDDLDQTANNTTLSDNFLIAFDNAGTAVLAFVAANIQPDSRFQASDGGDLIIEDYTVTNLETAKIFVGLLPFSKIANLFAEAEDETITAAARLYFDGAGEDTVTENDGVWAATTNCAVDENNLVENSVGSACVEITSSAAGAVVATCTPAAPLGKLTKFDFLKLYLHGTPDGGAVTVRLVDADGDSVTKSQAITGSAVQYSLDLPHSATDLQGWTQVGTYDFATLTAITVEWTAAGAGELVYVDGLHEYIGTTTARGRGETLSGSSAVVLDAQNEEVYQAISAIEATLPNGRYLVLVRAKDTDQVATDFLYQNYNTSDSSWLNQENANTAETLTSSFAYYQQIIDVVDSHHGDGVHVPRVVKNTVTENTIFVDSILIVPLGDGETLPADLAHSVMRKVGSQRRPVDRRETV